MMTLLHKLLSVLAWLLMEVAWCCTWLAYKVVDLQAKQETVDIAMAYRAAIDSQEEVR